MTYSLYNKMSIPQDVRNTFPRNSIPLLPKLPPFRLFSLLQLRNPGFDQRHDFLTPRVPCLFQHLLNREGKCCLLEKQLKRIKTLLPDCLIKNKNTYHGSLMNHLVHGLQRPRKLQCGVESTITIPRTLFWISPIVQKIMDER